MGEFLIVPQNVLREAETLGSCEVKMKKVVELLENVQSGICLGEATVEIKDVLAADISELTVLQKSLNNMSKQLQTIVNEYIRADSNENKIVNYEKNQVCAKTIDVEKNLGEIWNKIRDLTEKLGMTLKEAASFLADFFELIGKAGIEALFGEDTDWEKWFFKYVPENVSDETMLGIFSLLSIIGMSTDTVKEHRTNNEEAWMKYQKEHSDGNYIEKQSDMTGIQYGNHTGDYNACEVIAVYNALQYLNMGNSPDSFPELLAYFEQNGIAAQGEFGTSPQALNVYFEKEGYDTKLLAGNDISLEKISDMDKNYDTYIMTTYNNKSDLNSMVHTVSITKENGMYVIHNDYEGTKSYKTLEEAVRGYKNGEGEPISLIGIK